MKSTLKDIMKKKNMWLSMYKTLFIIWISTFQTLTFFFLSSSMHTHLSTGDLNNDDSIYTRKFSINFHYVINLFKFLYQKIDNRWWVRQGYLINWCRKCWWRYWCTLRSLRDFPWGPSWSGSTLSSRRSRSRLRRSVSSWLRWSYRVICWTAQFWFYCKWCRSPSRSQRCSAPLVPSSVVFPRTPFVPFCLQFAKRKCRRTL